MGELALTSTVFTLIEVHNAMKSKAKNRNVSAPSGFGSDDNGGPRAFGAIGGGGPQNIRWVTTANADSVPRPTPRSTADASQVPMPSEGRGAPILVETRLERIAPQLAETLILYRAPRAVSTDAVSIHAKLDEIRALPKYSKVVEAIGLGLDEMGGGGNVVDLQLVYERLDDIIRNNPEASPLQIARVFRDQVRKTAIDSAD